MSIVSIPIVSTVRRAITVAALALAGIAAWGPGADAPAAGRTVAVLDIKGPIGPATSDYVGRGLKRAQELGSAAVVLRMDTPGGLSSAMREIIRDIIAAPFPVIGYVAPGGAHAASAGTYILYAAHVAAMAPGTNLGAATPVPLSSPIPGIGGGPKDKEKEKEKDKNKDKKTTPETDRPSAGAPERKAINDARAYIRALAQMRGRNVEWAEKAVTEAATLSAQEALEEKVIDLIAATLAELLDRVDGRMVKLEKGEVRLETRDAPIQVIEPDWRAQFLAVITSPNVAYILLMIGIYGLIFEFYNPGIIFSGVIGAICLVLALYALHVLPVNYAGLGLILLGTGFMIAEAFVPAFGVLGLGGIAALVIGSIILIDTEAPGFGISWAVIGSVAAVSAVLSFTLLAIAARAWRRPVVSGREAMIGARGRVVNWQDGAGRVRVHGEIWQASGDQTLRPGQDIVVTSMDGLVLRISAGEAAEGAKNGYSA